MAQQRQIDNDVTTAAAKGLMKAWPKPKSQRMEAREVRKRLHIEVIHTTLCLQKSMAATRHTMRMFRTTTPDVTNPQELMARREKVLHLDPTINPELPSPCSKRNESSAPHTAK